MVKSMPAANLKMCANKLSPPQKKKIQPKNMLLSSFNVTARVTSNKPISISDVPKLKLKKEKLSGIGNKSKTKQTTFTINNDQ